MCRSLEFKDTIMDFQQLLPARIDVGLAHNTVESFDFAGKWCLANSVSCGNTSLNPMLYSMAINGTLVASGTALTDIFVWSIEEANAGKILQVLKGHTGPVLRLLWIGKGGSKLLLSCGADKIVRLWDPAKGAALRTFFGHEERVYDVLHFPDQNVIMTAGEDSSFILWDLDTARMLHTEKGCERIIWRLARSGSAVAVGGNDGAVQVYDVRKLLLQSPNSFSTTGKISDFGLGWNFADHCPAANKGDYVKHIRLCQEQRYGKWQLVAVVCSNEGKLMRVQPEDGNTRMICDVGCRISAVCPVPPIGVKHNLCVLSLLCGGMAVVNRSGSAGPESVYWKADSANINLVELGSVATHHSAEFFTCSVAGTIKQWELSIREDNELSVSCKRGFHHISSGASLTCMCVVNDHIVTGDSDGKLCLFSKTKATQIFSGQFHKGSKVTLLKSDGRFVYSVGKDARINRYCVEESGLSLEEAMSAVHFPQISDLQFCRRESLPTARLIVGGCTKTYGYVWNFSDEYPVFLSDCECRNRPLHFWADPANPANLLCCFYRKDRITFFNYLGESSARQPVITPQFHPARTLCVCSKRVSPSLTLVATGGEDAKFKLVLFSALNEDWNQSLPYAECVKTLNIHDSCVKAVKFVTERTHGKGKRVRYLLSGGAQSVLTVSELSLEDVANPNIKVGLATIRLAEEDDVKVMCVDSRLEEERLRILIGNTAGMVFSLEFAVDSRKLSVSGKDTLPACIMCCQLCPKGEKMFGLAGSNEGKLYLYQISSASELIRLQEIALHEFGLNAMDVKRVKEGGHCIVTGGTDGRICVSVLDEGKVIKLFALDWAHDSSVRAVKFLTPGLVVTGGYDQRLKFWRVDSKSGTLALIRTEESAVGDMNDLSIVREIKDKHTRYELFVVGSGLDRFAIRDDNTVQ